jgi:hypothetical protein
MKTKPTASAVGLYKLKDDTHLPQVVGGNHRQGLARHDEARVTPTVDLLEDVVRSRRTTSLETLSWRCPLAPHHFLEGIRERCRRQVSRQALHRQQHHQSLAKHCWALIKALPLSGKEARRRLPLAREGSMPEKALRPGRGKKAYERRLLPLLGGRLG